MILEYEKEMLLLNICPAFLDVSFREDEEGEKYVYKTEGYIRFAKYEFAELDMYLSFMHELIISLDECEDYLMCAGKVMLDEESIYIHHKTGKVRLMYGGDGSAELIPVMRDFFNLQLGRKNILGSSVALKQILDKMDEQNPDLYDLLKILEEVRREWNNIQPNTTND